MGGAGGLLERGSLGAGHEDDRRRGLVGERRHRVGVLVSLLFQAREGAEAGGSRGRRIEEAGPGGGELEKAEGVAGGGGVKDDVVEGLLGESALEEAGELVEGGNLRRAGS